MDKASLRAAFTAAGLSRLLKDIDYISKTAIRLSTTTVDESNLPIGASKLGGTPDLAADITWPEWKGLPQSFIAQIRLEDVRPYDTDHLLPQSGLLWFFYDAKQETYGDNPADSGGWRVLFSNDPSEHLQRTPAPAALPPSSRFKTCSIDFSSKITLSQFPQLDVPNFDWTLEEQKKYENLLSTFPNPTEHAAIQDQLLGFPDTLQDDMPLQCQLVSNGVTDPNDPLATALSQGAKDWQLLLQVDSDENAGMRWADSGMLYYWIKVADLQACTFNATWLVLQSE
jgi:uncharacterized protein YwqG